MAKVKTVKKKTAKSAVNKAKIKKLAVKAVKPKKISVKTLKPKKAALKTVKLKKVAAKKVKTKVAAVEALKAKKSVIKKVSPKTVKLKKAAFVKIKVEKAVLKASDKKVSNLKDKADIIKINNELAIKKLIRNNSTLPKEEVKEKKLKKFKPNKKSKYTAAELKHFRNIILKERKAIIESAKANMASLVDNETGEYKGDNLTYSTHMAEQGTDEMEREKNYLFVQRDEKYLGYLQDALTRIDQGTFGICIDCRDETKNLCRTCPLIQKERLELVPITQHCIECKNLRG